MSVINLEKNEAAMLVNTKPNKYTIPGIKDNSIKIKPMTRAPFDPNKELRSKTVNLSPKTKIFWK